MKPLQHHILSFQVQPDSQCAVCIGSRDYNTVFYCAIVYEVAVEDHLYNKAPLLATLNGIDGAYNSDSIYSIRKLSEDEILERDRKARN